MAPIYYRKSDAIIIVYDITDMNSFERAKRWVSTLKEEYQKKLPIYLAGNKCDLEEARQVPTSTAKKYCELEEIYFGECSAKSDINIKYIFEFLANKISLNKEDNNSDLFLNSQPRSQPTKKCCN